MLEPAPSSRREWSEVEDLDRLRAFNATIHYVLPKLLLVTTAFEMSAFKGPAQNGSPARGGGAGEIPLGVADGTTRAEMVGPDKAAGVVATLFARIKERHDHPLVSSYYRALGNWPDFLEAHGARWSHGSAPMRTSSGNAL